MRVLTSGRSILMVICENFRRVTSMLVIGVDIVVHGELLVVVRVVPVLLVML